MYFSYCKAEKNLCVLHGQVFVMHKPCTSGGLRVGSRGLLEAASWPKLFHFHGEFQENLCESRQTNPPFLQLNPLFRNPGSAPVSSP